MSRCTIPRARRPAVTVEGSAVGARVRPTGGAVHVQPAEPDPNQCRRNRIPLIKSTTVEPVSIAVSPAVLAMSVALLITWPAPLATPLATSLASSLAWLATPLTMPSD